MQLVPMIRYDGLLANVHPDEVANYRAGGYSVVEAAPVAAPVVDQSPKRGHPRKAD